MKTHKVDGQVLNEQEYQEYRRNYRAEWEKKKYYLDEEHRAQKLEKKRERYATQNPDSKRDMLTNMSKKRKNKLDNMSKPERDQFLKDKREYARKRRDKNIAEDTRNKFEEMDAKAKSKFLDKLLRYSNLVQEFETEVDARRVEITS